MTVSSEFNEVRMQQLFEALGVLSSLETMELNLQTPQPPKQIAADGHTA